MAAPINKENLGNYNKTKLYYSDEELREWVKGLVIKDKLKSIVTHKIYDNLRSYYSSLIKLDSISRRTHNYYFRKYYLKDNKCKSCNKDIEKEFLLTFDCSLNFLPNWCKEHYINKEWLKNNGKHGIEANLKRSQKRKIFLNTDRGKEYCKNVGTKNKINTTKWQSLKTNEQKLITRNKSSYSQILNILNGNFDPQKNYRHFYKNECFINDTSYIFRSSWEVCFFISNPHLQYETLRIKYLKENGRSGIYIPDFIDNQNKIIYELKPRRNFVKQQIKMDEAIKWCLENGYKFIWINEDNLIYYFNIEDNLDNRNNKFYEKLIKGINGNIKNKINKVL
jgi:hypothetical protein